MTSNLTFKRLSNQDILLVIFRVNSIQGLDVDQYIRIVTLGEDWPLPP
jgi:hypothetical protein